MIRVPIIFVAGAPFPCKTACWDHLVVACDQLLTVAPKERSLVYSPARAENAVALRVSPCIASYLNWAVAQN